MHHTQPYEFPGWGINRKGLHFLSQVACSTPNLLDSCVASFLLLLRWTECEETQENRFRSSCANCTRLSTLVDGGISGSSVPLFDPWYQKCCCKMGLQTYSILHMSCLLHLTVVTVMFLLSFSDFSVLEKRDQHLLVQLCHLQHVGQPAVESHAKASLATLACQGKPQVAGFSVSMSQFHNRDWEAQRDEAGES